MKEPGFAAAWQEDVYVHMWQGGTQGLPTQQFLSGGELGALIELKLCLQLFLKLVLSKKKNGPGGIYL